MVARTRLQDQRSREPFKLSESRKA
jgi:hypothetical protein